MFFKWTDASVRLTGRWSRIPEEKKDIYRFIQHPSDFTAATAAGSSFEIAFRGDRIAMVFDRGYRVNPAPHLWVSLDGGPRFEAPVDRYIRVQAKEGGDHIVQVVYKGGMEMLPRWYEPLMGAVCFCGYEADEAGVLPEDSRPLIEFLGDSITEGVLIEDDHVDAALGPVDQFNRPYQDDNCASYGWLTAEKLNMRPMFQAYGAIGLTRSGCGGVPRAGIIFPYVFDDVPYTGEIPDVTVINHGTNDRGASAPEVVARYAELLDMIHARGKDTRIVCISPFVGAFHDELRDFIAEWNRTHDYEVLYVDTAGWVEPEPLHPQMYRHACVAEQLAPMIGGWLKKN